MHELTFTKAIIDKIKDKEKVKAIELEVGELAGIEPDHLREHIEELTGWNVKVKRTKSKIICDCGFKGQAKIQERSHDIVIFCCPNCNSLPQVVEGADIKLKKATYF